MKKLYPNNDFIFIQDARSHRANIIKNYLRNELISRFGANTERPATTSPNCNPLYYLFWNEIIIIILMSFGISLEP